MATATKKNYTVTEAAEKLGISPAAVRRHCQHGNCMSEYHEFPGTKRGFYLVSEKGLEWLRQNVSPRTSSDS